VTQKYVSKVLPPHPEEPEVTETELQSHRPVQELLLILPFMNAIVDLPHTHILLACLAPSQCDFMLDHYTWL
jgi:hypothetical protein